MKIKILSALLISMVTLGVMGCSAKTADGENQTSGGSTITAQVTGEMTEIVSPPPTPEEQAEAIMAGMSMEEKVGQMFFARCPEINGAAEAGQWHLGGYILFARDFENKTPETVQANIASYQNESAIPLLIGIDEEGGSVVRASKYPAFRQTPFLSPQKLFAEGGFDKIQSDTEEKSQFLKDLGINVNLAPIADVSTDSGDYIYPRTLGQNAENTAIYVSIVVTEMKEAGIGSVLKHFPGYGNNTDTHTGVAYDNRPLTQFQQEDFLPFKAGINMGAGSILVSHNVVTAMDSNLPASLSPQVNKILREELDFEGVIMTDDLAMAGVRSFSETDTAVLAIIAGNDLIISSDYASQIEKVLEAVKKGEISDYHINTSVKRILMWKIELGLIEPV